MTRFLCIPSHSLDRQGLCGDCVSGIVLGSGDTGKRPHPFPSCSPSRELLGSHPNEGTEALGRRYRHGAPDRAPQTFSYALHVFSDGKPLNVCGFYIYILVTVGRIITHVF